MIEYEYISITGEKVSDLGSATDLIAKLEILDRIERDFRTCDPDCESIVRYAMAREANAIRKAVFNK